ncbi:MAG TPA: hypothetical protein VJ837_05325, partial [Candidatus Paceibacterota bacterium]|nr:hypothetical protein [Candidatus Paceibacterota bacterium]
FTLLYPCHDRATRGALRALLLLTLRSTMKSASPTRIKITPIAGGITIIGTVLFGRSIDMQMTVASSLESDCTAYRGDGFR